MKQKIKTIFSLFLVANCFLTAAIEENCGEANFEQPRSEERMQNLQYLAEKCFYSTDFKCHDPRYIRIKMSYFVGTFLDVNELITLGRENIDIFFDDLPQEEVTICHTDEQIKPDYFDGCSFLSLFVDACAEILRENQEVGKTWLGDFLIDKRKKQVVFMYLRNEEQFRSILKTDEDPYVLKNIENFRIFLSVFTEIFLDLMDKPADGTRFKRFKEFFEEIKDNYDKPSIEYLKDSLKFGIDMKDRTSNAPVRRLGSLCSLIDILLQRDSFFDFICRGNYFRSPKQTELAVQNMLTEPRFAEIAQQLADFLRLNLAPEEYDLTRSFRRTGSEKIFIVKVLPNLLERKPLQFVSIDDLDKQRIDKILNLPELEMTMLFYINPESWNHYAKDHGISNIDRNLLLEILFPTTNSLDKISSDQDILDNMYRRYGANEEVYKLFAVIIEHLTFFELNEEECIVEGEIVEGEISISRKVSGLINAEVPVIRAIYDLQKVKSKLSELEQQYGKGTEEYKNALKEAKIYYTYPWMFDESVPEDRQTCLFEEKSISEVVESIVKAREIEGSLQKYLLEEQLSDFDLVSLQNDLI